MGDQENARPSRRRRVVTVRGPEAPNLNQRPRSEASRGDRRSKDRERGASKNEVDGSRRVLEKDFPQGIKRTA